MQQPRNAVKIGNSHAKNKFADVSKPGCRSKAAYDAVMEYHKRVPSAWWAGNPFDYSSKKKYNCVFAHRFFDTEGYFRAISVGNDGSINEHYKSDNPTFKAETDEVQLIYGAFSG